ncbi:HAMP domain-containing sensor histidine kinase [soil metagenome]
MRGTDSSTTGRSGEALTVSSSPATAAVLSLRRRLTAVAVLVLAVVLVVAGVVLVGVQRRQLEDRIDDRLRARADEVEALLAADIDPQPVIEDGRLEERAAQIVTADGEVIAATQNLSGLEPIAAVPSDDEVLRTVDDLPVDDDRFHVLSRRITIDGSPGVVHVAETVDEVDESVNTLVRSLAFAVPPVLLMLAWLTWWLTGRAVRPVEEAAIRQARFVSDASHELRSPLTRLRTRLEVDLAHPDGVDLRDTAAAALDESRAMEHLVDDLLHLARSDGVPHRARWTVFDLDDVVLGEARATATHGDRVDTSGVSGAVVRGDRAELARVVRNLVDNAARHAETSVVIALGDVGRSVMLTVDDDGPGIAADQRTHVFERFTRLDEARSRTRGGVGLGLSIARDIVVRHGGTVEIDDAPIGGARLRVVLPQPRDSAAR